MATVIGTCLGLIIGIIFGCLITVVLLCEKYQLFSQNRNYDKTQKSNKRNKRSKIN